MPVKPFQLGKAKKPDFAADLMKQMDAAIVSLGKQVVVGDFAVDEPHCVKVIKRMYQKAEEAFDAGEVESGWKMMNSAMAGSLKLTEIHAKTALGLQLAIDRAEERRDRAIAYANRDGGGSVVASEDGNRAVAAARSILAGKMYVSDAHFTKADLGEDDAEEA